MAKKLPVMVKKMITNANLVLLMNGNKIAWDIFADHLHKADAYRGFGVYWSTDHLRLFLRTADENKIYSDREDNICHMHAVVLKRSKETWYNMTEGKELPEDIGTWSPEFMSYLFNELESENFVYYMGA